MFIRSFNFSYSFLMLSFIFISIFGLFYDMNSLWRTKKTGSCIKKAKRKPRQSYDTYIKLIMNHFTRFNLNICAFFADFLPSIPFYIFWDDEKKEACWKPCLKLDFNETSEEEIKVKKKYVRGIRYIIVSQTFSAHLIAKHRSKRCMKHS